MSSVVISGDTSGTVTLQVPAVAGTTTLTLPATSGTVLTSASGQSLVSPAITGTPTISGVAFGPYTMKKRIINGAMLFDQRNAGVTVNNVAGNVYTLDRWQANGDQASKFSVYQNANSAASYSATGQYYSMGITSLSSYSVPSGEGYIIRQRIEGYNIQDLAWGTANAKTVTLSFQVYCSLSGTFGGVITNSANNRSYPFSYTISSANTWTTISVTIPGDTTGTWLTTNGVGIQIFFGLGVGSTLSGTAGAWAGASYYSATGATSIVGTNGATWYITGVQLEVGSTATAFEWRPYGQELFLCERYFQIFANTVIDNTSCICTATAIDTSNLIGMVNLHTPMRGQPSLVTTATQFRANLGTVNANSTTAPTVTQNSDISLRFNQGGYAAGLTADKSGILRFNGGTGYCAASAEL